MDGNLARWVFFTGFVELSLAILIDIYIIHLQLRQFKVKSDLQPVKYMLLTGMISLICASLPLTVVYASFLWFHWTSVWPVYIAVIANGFAKLIVASMFYLSYRY